MPRKKLTLEQEKEIKLLRANNKMYENTLEEAKMKGNKDGVARILEAKKDIVDKINEKSIELSKCIIRLFI